MVSFIILSNCKYTGYMIKGRGQGVAKNTDLKYLGTIMVLFGTYCSGGLKMLKNNFSAPYLLNEMVSSYQITQRDHDVTMASN